MNGESVLMSAYMFHFEEIIFDFFGVLLVIVRGLNFYFYPVSSRSTVGVLS